MINLRESFENIVRMLANNGDVRVSFDDQSTNCKDYSST